MADTCIVCLGDLAALTTSQERHSLEADAQTTTPEERVRNDTFPEDGPNTVAHLLPCGHNLHHECLRPWVERANSCPICRADFNMVELRTYLDGPPLSSYAVQEKRQEADIDPSVIVDDELLDESLSQPCLYCEDESEEEKLLLCDGCNGAYHTYCVGLRSVPAGNWYCQFCRDDGIDEAQSRPRQGRPRTRGQQRRRAAGADPQTHEWARVWRSVWQHTNIDLDFPFEEEEDENEQLERQQRELDGISRRMEIAEQSGSATRFRDAANSILAARGRRSQTSTPTSESQEELRAWNAFDKFSQLHSNSSPAAPGRKRKSITASPAEPQPAEPERKLKRPRTRMPQEPQGHQSTPRAESSLTARRRAINAASPQAQSPPPPPDTSDVTAAPSFLQSLLREVETQPGSSGHTPQHQEKDPLSIMVPNRSDSASPLSSPASSPSSSGISSPRARSMSPGGQRSRPASPPPLSSRIEPIYQYSPTSPGSTSNDAQDKNDSSASPQTLPTRTIAEPRRAYHPSTNESASPNANIIRNAKKEIQTLVTANLKPLYRRKEISTEQYTNINRQISRQLYDRVTQGGGLQDEELERWKGIAAQEVESAVRALKTVKA